MIGGFNNISALASDLMSTMRAFAPADLFTLNQALPTAPGWPAPSVGTQLAAVAFQRSVIGIARDLRAQAAKASSDLEAQVGVSAPVIATIIGKQSSDLRKLSMQYYGTQDNWQKIASFNGLSGGLIPPGKLLMVPRL
jgi:nucleoid-associated protein YgaU